MNLVDAGLSPLGAGLGLLAGTGTWLALRGVPTFARPSLDARLAPHLADRPRGSRLLAPGRAPAGVVARVLGTAPGGLLAPLARAAARRSPSTTAVALRLQQAGSATTVEHYRAEQVVWGALGAAAALLLALVVVARGGPLLAAVLLVPAGAAAGVLARDQVLGRAVRLREERLLAELPTVAELLALAVGAGEGAVGALDRVSRTCRGELAGELRTTLADARAGTPLVTALARMGQRTSAAPLARFVDGVAVAVDMGSPLADVLTAQAQDVRQLARRRLVEAGGRKELAMLVPVVFLILPVTVVFAVYPGLAVLSLTP
ncbi:tight adherence protein C [Quadrisphaera granulorum]|uniref:Tight adherence protein C n=1 Tax=Quadrisphaera granulorum TaxID=317664 RepID=A0A316ABP6_9ACTN|nr:type II secretion system F family protein [Quadrisphaera granulorum]PWJ54839.1 tight adherence protein C [Quadrisphaera granulorum]SZE95785.1 tight adherence protein C [Quadrisphaera granulorum]